jgi:outer membrane lipoprotein-sorting protein
VKVEAKPAPEPQKPASPPPAETAEQPKPAAPPPVKIAEPPKPARATPAVAVPAATAVAAPATAPTPVSPPGPKSPEEALDRVNAYFNSIDVMSAYFVQKNPNGQQAEGALSMRRPGQFHFAYAPPSTLEVVSDGRNVAIRDKKLGTNDVYPVGQTPLKFLVQDNIDLSRDTKVRDVQVGRDGIVTVRFDDSATLGGTSKITLRFDTRANALRQWTIIDAQGYETTVTLSGLNATYRRDTRASQ